MLIIIKQNLATLLDISVDNLLNRDNYRGVSGGSGKWWKQCLSCCSTSSDSLYVHCEMAHMYERAKACITTVWCCFHLLMKASNLANASTANKYRMFSSSDQPKWEVNRPLIILSSIVIERTIQWYTQMLEQGDLMTVY